MADEFTNIAATRRQNKRICSLRSKKYTYFTKYVAYFSNRPEKPGAIRISMIIIHKIGADTSQNPHSRKKKAEFTAAQYRKRQ
jgi:hypothetical protein